MPELPEVARTAITLHQSMSGAAILEIKIHSGRYSRHGSPEGYAEISQHLPIYVSSVTSKGKFILITAANPLKNWYIWNTLGMSGSWKMERSKHSHIEFVTDKGSFFFTDMRNFGTIKFTDSLEKTSAKLQSIGPDHLGIAISDLEFKQRISRKSKLNITKALMDQSLISGVGNYIKAEALYMAGISPLRIVGSLSDSEFSKLNKAISEIVVASFLSGGATIKTYSGLNDEKGNYTFSFKVYGRKKCEAGFDVVRETTEDGRTTHWVPELQK